VNAGRSPGGARRLTGIGESITDLEEVSILTSSPWDIGMDFAAPSMSTRAGLLFL
jgi:hypothetical protein